MRCHAGLRSFTIGAAISSAVHGVKPGLR